MSFNFPSSIFSVGVNQPSQLRRGADVTGRTSGMGVPSVADSIADKEPVTFHSPGVRLQQNLLP